MASRAPRRGTAAGAGACAPRRGIRATCPATWTGGAAGAWPARGPWPRAVRCRRTESPWPRWCAAGGAKPVASRGATWPRAVRRGPTDRAARHTGERADPGADRARLEHAEPAEPAGPVGPGEVRALVVGCARVRARLSPVVRGVEALPSAWPGCASSRPCGAWSPCRPPDPGCAGSRRRPRSGCGYARRAGCGSPAVCRAGARGPGRGSPAVGRAQGRGHARRTGRGSLIVHHARARKPRSPAPRRQPPGAHCSFRRGCRILEVWSSSGTSRSSGRGGRRG